VARTLHGNGAGKDDVREGTHGMRIGGGAIALIVLVLLLIWIF